MIASRRNLKFYNGTGKLLGTLQDMICHVSDITGVHQEMLSGYRALSSFSVAQRMSWASKRQTSRLEDEAYSLLGIFGISLVTTYGEGHRAFARLQEEILKSGSDHTIFAWGYDNDVNLSTLSHSPQLNYMSNILAESPDAFRGQHCRRMVNVERFHSQRKYEVSANSIDIELYVSGAAKKPEAYRTLDVCVAILNCCFEDDPSRYLILKLLKCEFGVFSRSQVGSCDIYDAVQSGSQLSLIILRDAPWLSMGHFARALISDGPPRRLMFRCSQRLNDLLQIRDGSCSIIGFLSDGVEAPLTEHVEAVLSLERSGLFFISTLEFGNRIANHRPRSYMARGFVDLQTNASSMKAIRVSFMLRARDLAQWRYKGHEYPVNVPTHSQVHTEFDRRRCDQSKIAYLANYLISPANFVLGNGRVITSRQIEHSFLENRFHLIEIDVHGWGYLLYLLLLERLWTWVNGFMATVLSEFISIRWRVMDAIMYGITYIMTQ